MTVSELPPRDAEGLNERHEKVDGESTWKRMTKMNSSEVRNLSVSSRHLSGGNMWRFALLQVHFSCYLVWC